MGLSPSFSINFWKQIWAAAEEMMQRAPKRKKKRPNASDWRPSKRPKNDARTNTATVKQRRAKLCKRQQLKEINQKKRRKEAETEEAAVEEEERRIRKKMLMRILLLLIDGTLCLFNCFAE